MCSLKKMSIRVKSSTPIELREVVQQLKPLLIEVNKCIKLINQETATEAHHLEIWQ